MKITPFQQALQHEMNRLEMITAHADQSVPNFSLLSLQKPKATKNRRFLLQFFQHVLSF